MTELEASATDQTFINETKRIEFLFELYDKYTSGMFQNQKAKGKSKKEGRCRVSFSFGERLRMRVARGLVGEGKMKVKKYKWVEG